MVDFYKEPNPTNDPNYLGMSKEPDRVQANTGLGKLFENIGELGGNIFRATDQIIKEGIKKDANSLIDPIQDQHGSSMTPDEVRGIAGTGAKGRVRALQMRNGVGIDDSADTSALGYGPDDAKRDLSQVESIFPVNDKRPLPPQASREVSQLQRLQQAYYAGNLSDSYYNAQLVSVAKQLRAQYPGYRDEVDAAISGITGIQPANALRASLMRDIQSNLAAQMQNANADDKWRDQNARYAVAAGYDPYKTDINTLKPAVAEFRGQQEIMRAQELRVNVGSPEAESLLSGKVGKVFTGGLIAMSNQAQGQKSLAQFQEEARQLALKGGGSPKEIADLATRMEMTMNQLKVNARQIAYLPIEGDNEGRSLVSKVKDGDQKIDNVIEAQSRPWKDAINLVKSGQMSALQTNTDMLKHDRNIDLQNLFRAFPDARVATAISNAFPNNPIMSNRFLEQSKILPDFGNAIKNGLGNAILNGTDVKPAPTPSQAVNSYGPDINKAHPDEVYKQTAKQYDMVISPENKNSENAAHVAKQFFKDTQFYDNLSDTGRYKLFLQMAAPSKTQFIKSLGPEVENAYKDWAQYAAGDIYRRAADNLNAHLSDSRLNISFDPKGMKFIDHTVYDQDTSSARQKEFVGRQVGAINNAITWLRPIVGDDMAQILPALQVNPMRLKEDDMAMKMAKGLAAQIKPGEQIKDGLFKGWDDFREKLGLPAEEAATKRAKGEGGNPQ